VVGFTRNLPYDFEIDSIPIYDDRLFQFHFDAPKQFKLKENQLENEVTSRNSTPRRKKTYIKKNKSRKENVEKKTTSKITREIITTSEKDHVEKISL